MIKEIYEVIKLLMTLVHRDGKQFRPSSYRRDGGLLVQLSTDAHQSDKLTCTIAAAGAWCPQTTEAVYAEVTASLPVSASVGDGECRASAELTRFTASTGPANFILSFEVRNVESGCQKEWDQMESFLHRISLIHAQLKIWYEVKDNRKTHQVIFGDDVNSKILLKNQSIVMDIASYQLSPFSVGGLESCDQMHGVMGAEVPLVLPPGLLETGLCGEASIIPMATLAPCMDQYPNWPVRLSAIQVLVYSPCCVPLLETLNMAAPLSFLQALTTSVHWERWGLSGVTCADKQMVEGKEPGPRGSLCCDIVFGVESTEGDQEVGPQWSPTVSQTLTLFLFLQHSDPFHSQLSDIMANEEELEKHLDQVLWHNSERVTSSLNSLLQRILDPYQKKCSNHEKMQSALSVIQSSLTTVMNSSSSVEFRNACLGHMKAQDTHQVSMCLGRSLHSVTEGRFIPIYRCTNKKPGVSGGQNSTVQKADGQDRNPHSLRHPSPRKRCFPLQTLLIANSIAQTQHL
ncbi:DUF4554 domain-containing protein [Engraulis encrasicolus]|uniref:DUF4554 domain-containing protein n=1 Tax=Engraulis encrasicolus TaxID=184585 RepID=UPI002FD3500B